MIKGHARRVLNTRPPRRAVDSGVYRALLAVAAVAVLSILTLSAFAFPLMSANAPRIIVGASTPLTAGTLIGAASPNLKVAASVGFFNSSRQDLVNQMLQQMYTPSSYMYHQFLTSKEYSDLFAPSLSTYNSAAAYFQSFGISTYTDNSRLFMNLVGTAGQMQQAFSTSISVFTGRHYNFYANTGPILLPAGFASYVTSVVGLENYTFYVPDLTKVQGQPSSIPNPGPSPPPLPGLGYVPSELQGIYNETGLLAKGVDGRGSTIVLIDAGYGDKTIVADAVQFSAEFGLPVPVVSVQTVNSSSTVTDISTDPINGILSNFPGNPCEDAGACPPGAGWDIETGLDVEYAHTTAPGANLINMISFDPGVGLDEAIATTIVGSGTAVLPGQVVPPASTRGLIVSQSFGQCECVANATYSGGPATGGDGTFTDPFYRMAAALGETVLASSGDSGYTAIDANGNTVIDTGWPAANQWVTAVGGTTILPPETTPLTGVTSTYQGESAWSGSGGGYSTNNATSSEFGGGVPRPSWQVGPGLSTSGFDSKWRGVPDVAMEADANTGVDVVADGLNTGGVWGGTSLASPLYAGALAVYQDYNHNTALGFYNPFAYSILNSKYYSYAFHDITTGSNGFNAGSGWDPATGVGSPNIGNFVTCSQSATGARCAGVAPGPSPGVTISSPTGGQTFTSTTLPLAGTHSLAPANFILGTPNSAKDTAGQQQNSLDILQSWFSNYNSATGTFDVNIKVQDLTSLTVPPTGALGEHWEMTWSFNGASDYAEMVMWYTSVTSATAPGTPATNPTGAVGIFFYSGTITTDTTGTHVTENVVPGSYQASAPGVITIHVPVSDVGNPVAGSTFNKVATDAQEFIGTPALWLRFVVAETFTPPTATYNLGDPLKANGFVQLALNPQFVGASNATLVNYPASNQWTGSLDLTGLPTGLYTAFVRQVVAGTPGVPASVDFNFVAVSSAQAVLTLQTNARGYAQGGTVQVTGTVATPSGVPVSGRDVGVEIDSPTGTVFIDQVTTSSTGGYQTRFTLSSNALSGTYTLRAATWGLMATTTFSVGSKLGGGSSGSARGAIFSSPSSVAITGFAVNGTGGATITLKNAGTSVQSVLVPFEVLDQQGHVVFLGSKSLTLTGGQTVTVSFSFPQPSKGRYFAIGFAWNGMIGQEAGAWDPFSGRSSATFQVK